VQICFAGEHEHKRHGEKYLFTERRNSTFGTHHLSQFAWQGFFNQIIFQQYFEIHGSAQTPQAYA
jgi:hypothetical protein